MRLLEEVIDRGRVTRAELASSTRFSKPTVSEAVRRLAERGLVDATGSQETGRRGRVGTFYELGGAAGWVLAIKADQSGVIGWSADLAGRRIYAHEHPPGAAGDTDALAESLRTVTLGAVENAGSARGPLRAVAISIAAPVDPTTHEVIALPEAQFPEGTLSPTDVLAELVNVPVLVDNDVKLAALAEHRAGAAVGASNFAYVYVGGGIGLGLYINGQLIRGAHGLAGEIGYLPGSCAGPGSLAAELQASGLGRPDAPSTDVTAILDILDRARRNDQAAQRAVTQLSTAIARAIVSINAVVDPELVLLGGPVGTHPDLLRSVHEALVLISPSSLGPHRLAYGTLGAHAPLTGATYNALDHAKAAAVQDQSDTAPAG